MAYGRHRQCRDQKAIDALYQEPLDAFTAKRNALAAELRKAGDRATADVVKALSKPSVTAWAINQVWWGNRDVFQAMLAAGARLKDAHLSWSSGGPTDVRAAAEDRAPGGASRGRGRPGRPRQSEDRGARHAIPHLRHGGGVGLRCDRRRHAWPALPRSAVQRA